MCGICVTWALRSKNAEADFAKSLKALVPRGPDSTNTCTVNVFGSTCHIGFTRLHIQGAPGLEQPFRNDDRIVLCNGEIFNADLLTESLGLKLPKGSSDCAVIPAMLDLGMPLAEVSRQLDGDFAIVTVNLKNGYVEVSRDPYGVRPMYLVYTEDSVSLVSELKAQPSNATYIHTIQPGHAYKIEITTGDYTKEQWHQVPWLKNPSLCDGVKASEALKVALEAAVQKRLTTVRELGACLSGGLDSSLVAAIAAQLMKAKGLQLHTYSIGMAGSPDLKHARLVAEHIGSIHHERFITPADCLAAVPDVIYSVETCDITSVRASVGNFLLGRFIAEVTPTVKVVLNGDGADEALGGYLYMRSAPTDTAFETETDRLMNEIHLYDVARSERSMAANGLESRSPFLDRQFISVARSIPTGLLRSCCVGSNHAGPTEQSIEKKVLRQAYSGTGLLPSLVLWRRKEAFSDGISPTDQGKPWFETAGVQDMEGAKRYSTNTPKTPEALWYRQLFVSYFSDLATIPAMWMPRFVKATDPSARTLHDYKN